MLSLRADSFEVRLAAGAGGATGGCALPALWTATAALAEPGQALVLPIRSTDAHYFIRPCSGATSIYQPTIAAQPVSGVGDVRVRQVNVDDGEVVLEGTLATQERLAPAASDLIWLRLPLGPPIGDPLDVHAHLEERTALAAGEWRFRGLPQRLPPQHIAAVRDAAGIPIARVPFDLVPLLSSPYDLHALAVLAVRALLVDQQNTLPEALDEVHSLAREVAAAAADNPEVGLALRIQSIFERDPRWERQIGPQRLVRDEISPAEGFRCVPHEIWWDTLAMIVRALPAVGPDSTCRDFGHAPDGALHRVFDPLLDDLADLIRRTRSLIVIDWSANREVGHVLDSFIAET